MKEYKNKKRTKKFFSSKIGIFLICVVLAVMTYPVFRIYLKSRQANQMNEGMSQELKELQARKEFLISEIARLKTEEGKEEELRKNFNVSKPNEELLIITDKKEAGEGDDKNSEGLWNKIKSWF